MCFLIGLVLHPIATIAQTTDVFISEIYPNPSSEEFEWVEVFNPGTEPVSLTDWWLTDELTNPSIIFQFSISEPPLQPYEFRQIKTASNKLNNTGDSVFLYTNLGSVVSRLSYTSSQTAFSQQRETATSEESVRTSATPNADNPLYTLLPVPTATPTPLTSPIPAVTPSPTPQVPSPQPTSSPTPQSTALPSPSPTSTPLPISIGQISINELFACPTDGQPEGIELFNSGNALTASAWRVTDQSGNYRVLSGNLPAVSYTVLSWSGSLLNNSGDSIVLTSDAGQILDSLSYDDCTSGLSLAPDDNDTWIPTIPTPSSSNVLPHTTPPAAATTFNNSAFTPATATNQASPQSTKTPILGQLDDKTTVLPWYNPQGVQLESSASATQPTQLTTVHTPKVLGTSTHASTMEKPWALLFVIISGLLFAVSGLMPPYVTTSETSTRVGSGVVAAPAVGSAHFLV